MINLSLHLYGKPEWELPSEDEAIDGDLLKAHGDDLREHLYKVADIVEKLKKNGWNYELALYSLEFCKETTKTEAKKELNKLKINLKDISLKEYEDEEFEEEE